MKRKIACASLVAGFVGLLALPARAATPAEIQQSITNGLAWLVTQQGLDGAFGTYAPVGETGLAVWKLCDRARELAQDPLGTDYAYHTNVQNGLNYLFAQVQVASETTNDGNGNGMAAYWGDDSGYQTYYTALALSAIATCQNQAAVVNVPNSPVNGLTHRTVAQDALDWLVFGQNNSGCATGGWGYLANYTNWSDQSNTGYVTLGIKVASDAPPYGFGLAIPPAVLSQLSTYIQAVQDSGGGTHPEYAGGSWYEPCSGYQWVNILKTGHLLSEMALVGDSSGAARVQNAVAYIQREWNATGPQPEFASTSVGWKDDSQATFTMMKGLTLLNIRTLTVGGSAIDWFDQVSTQIVTTQNTNGSWPLTDYEGGESSQILTTCWSLLTLEKAVGAPVVVPSPVPALSMVGFTVVMVLLAFMGIWLVHKRAAGGLRRIG